MPWAIVGKCRNPAVTFLLRSLSYSVFHLTGQAQEACISDVFVYSISDTISAGFFFPYTYRFSNFLAINVVFHMQLSLKRPRVIADPTD